MIPLARAETSERLPTGPSQIASTERLLDRKGFVPLYFQIQRALVDKIDSGELQEGDLLGPEWNLARAYRVSRMTVREALHGLKASGYACSLRGRGTFVTKPKLDKPQAQLGGFTEEITQRGMVPTSRLLEQTVIDADVDLAESLEVQVGTPAMRLRRLRLADGIPMAVEKAYLSLSRFLVSNESTLPSSRSIKRFAKSLTFRQPGLLRQSKSCRQHAKSLDCWRFLQK